MFRGMAVGCVLAVADEGGVRDEGLGYGRDNWGVVLRDLG